MQTPTASCRSRGESCTTLTYLGESYLPDSYVGQCTTCGTVIHGHRSNWRYTVRDSTPVLLAKAERETPSTRTDRRVNPLARAPRPAPPAIEVSRLQGLSLDEAVKLLAHMGITIRA